MAQFDVGAEITRRGGQFKPFSHGEFLDQKPDLMKRGHCYGLTLVWLSRYVRDRRAGADLLGNLNFTQASKDPKTIMVIRQIQNMGNSRTAMQRQIDPAQANAAEKQQGLDAVFGQSDENLMTDILKSLNVPAIRFYGVPLDPMDKSDSLIYLMGRMTEGLYGILLGNHVVGAIVDKPNGVFKFLDVNYGQGVWKTKAGSAPMAGPAPDHFGGFTGFLKAYFADPEMRLSYAHENIKGVLGYASAPLP